MMGTRDYGLLFGPWPAVVRSYDQATRMCRVEVPGLTDGGDVLPNAEIMYPIGDKSRNGANTTEIEITPGDTVWVEFTGGDARYPVIKGYRNPQSNNSVDWRRFHHANMELLAEKLMQFIAGGDVLIQSGSQITLKAPLVVIDAPQTSVTGNESVAGGLTVDGTGSEAGSATSITGNVSVNGSIDASGTIMDVSGNSNHHTH
jgi:phage baseplate assembly protein gpV